MSNGSIIFKKIYGEIYRKVEYVSIPRKYAVRIQILKKTKIKVLNQYVIDHSIKCDPFKAEIGSVKQLKDSNRIFVYTDAGVSLKTGKVTCGIILTDGEKIIQRKILLPKLDPKGAITGETLSLVVGLQILRKAGITENEVVVYKDNINAIETVNSPPNFKDIVGENRWAKGKLWEEIGFFSQVRGE